MLRFSTLFHPPKATRLLLQLLLVVLLTAALSISALFIIQMPASAAAGTPRLDAGEKLLPGESLVCGNLTLIMQGDGNLVLYAPGGSVRWHSHTDGNPGAFAQMQSDGNFVIYSSTLQPLWSTQTNGKGAAFAQIQNDGNFVLYTRTGWPVWYTGTKYYPSRMTSGILVPGQGLQSPDGTYTATFQLDGNFVLHGPKGLLWQSGTANIGVNKLAVQPDGNMVLYGNDAWKWQSYTPSIGSVFLQVQNDGNMVLYTSASRAVWASNTAGGNPSPSAAPADPKANLRQAVVNTAMAQLGKPYIFGASGPNAFDCSGLVEFAYRQNGLVYWPSRGTTKTIINYGINVKGQALLPGDLVWPNKDHVMMYIGNGRCVEAPAPGTVIKTSPMPANPYAVRRYI